jgi:hypothetical protein
MVYICRVEFSHAEVLSFLWKDFFILSGLLLGYAACGGTLLRYAIASDGYAGANHFFSGRPVARCFFGDMVRGLPEKGPSGLLVEDCFGI